MTQTHRLALPAGTQLRDFQVLKVLGQGGFGITYLGLNTALDQRVAIKEYLPGAFAMRDGNTLSVQPNGADSEQVFHWGLQRFLEEARILARLSHPNIVRVLYFMSLNDTGYMVMEFLEGQTLGGWLKARGGTPVTQDDVLRILDPLTGALALVHDNGLAHRDIKPDNVFMRHGTAPVLIDFGAARNVFTGRSQTVAAIVTPGYSPNEQYSGTVNQGPWTDIYALGAVVYRMVVGDAPADSPSRIAHLMEGRPDPCLRFAEIAGTSFDPAFVAAVDWAMRLRADERPQSVQEWRAALGLGQGGTSTPAAADEPSTAARPEAPPSSTWWAPAEARSAPSAASIPWTGTAPPSTQTRAAAGRPSPLAWMIAAGIGVALVAAAAIWGTMLRDTDRIGNSIAQAFPIGLLGAEPVSISDSIGGGDPSDILRFDIAADSELTLRLDGPGEAAALRLIDADAQPVALFEEGANRLAEVRAGSYALEIGSQASFSLRYTLQLQGVPVTARARPGAEPRSALDLTGRGPLDGQAVLYDGRIWPGHREHFFRLRLDEPARVAILLDAPGGAGSLSLTDAGGIATATRQVTPESMQPLIQELAAGRYFIAVGSRGEAPWAYKLKVRIDGASLSRDGVSRPPTEEGRSFETAQILPDPRGEAQSFDIRMADGQPQRFFAIRVINAGTLTAGAEGERFNELELFRTEGIARITRAAGTSSLSLQSNVTPGRYVLRIGASAAPANGKMTLAIGAGALLGASQGQPLVLGAVGERPIEHSGSLRGEEEHWLAFALDQRRRIALEMTRGDGGPLPKGMTVSLLDPDGRSRPFMTRQDGEILSQSLPLEPGRYLLKLRGPDGQRLNYALKLFGTAKIGTDRTGSSGEARGADDSTMQGVASVRLKADMSRADALRLAKARARARLIEAGRQTGKPVAEPAGTASAAQLLAALRYGIPHRVTWQARWLGEDQLDIVMQARLQRPRGDEVLAASLPASRFGAGQRIEVSLKAAEQLRAGLFAWQADGTVLRLYPADAGEALTLRAGEKINATDRLKGGFSSAPMPGTEASEEAIIVLACPEAADFAALAPVPGSTVASSLSSAIETETFLEAVSGLCPGKLVVRVLPYRVENKSG